MLKQLEELLEQNIQLMNRFVRENDELNRAFRNETLGQFISSQNTNEDQNPMRQQEASVDEEKTKPIE